MKTIKNIHKKKNNALLMPHDPVKEVLDGELLGRAILECWQNNDPEGVIEVISGYLEVLNKAQSANRIQFPHSTLESKRNSLV